MLFVVGVFGALFIGCCVLLACVELLFIVWRCSLLFVVCYFMV